MENNLERDIDLDFGPFKRRAELNYNFIIFNDDI